MNPIECVPPPRDRSTRARFTAALGAALLALAGCQSDGTAAPTSGPSMAAYFELMQPRQIEIQHYLTRTVTYAGTGDADGLEVILAAKDSFGDPIKCVGTFHFELYARRPASGDPLGQEIAHWNNVQIDSEERIRGYWESLSRFFRFPLKLPGDPLPAGQYILVARLVTPTGAKLTDDYVFEHQQAALPSFDVALPDDQPAGTPIP